MNLAAAPRRRAWRPLPGRGPDPTRIAAVLDRTVRSFGTPTSARGVEVIFERWADVVGEAMAARTRPQQINGDTLVVGCDEPVVATQVRFLQAELVQRLSALANERHIRRIEVRVTGKPPRSRPPRSRAGGGR